MGANATHLSLVTDTQVDDTDIFYQRQVPIDIRDGLSMRAASGEISHLSHALGNDIA
jgi:hypothetical protein